MIMKYLVVDSMLFRDDVSDLEDQTSSDDREDIESDEDGSPCV